MMKKAMAGLCAILLLLTMSVGFAEEPNVPGKYDKLVVGTPTAFNGNFFSDAFGTNSSDQDVQHMLHGYNLVRWNSEEGMFVFDDSVVSGTIVTEDPAGNRTYTISLSGDLMYSDGTPITAKDYVFSLLLSSSDVLGELGGTVLHAGYIAGYEDYRTGKSDVLRGVRLLNDQMLSITISADYRPYFYEVGLMSVIPQPAFAIAPGIGVNDQGDGAALEGELTADLLRETLLDPVSGFITHPSVSSGPYKLISFDGTEAVFEINENYKGNYLGNKPTIPQLIFRYADNDTLLAGMENGEIDLANKVVRSDTIGNGMQLMGSGTVNMTNYSRTGCSFISFCCERPTVSDPAVRKAIAMCIDRQGMTDSYTGLYGMNVNGFYGLGQWMYQVLNGTKAPEFKTDKEAEDFARALEEVSLDDLPAYELDPEGAARILDDAGWTLNADGIRSRITDGEETLLTLELFYPEGNTLGSFFTDAVCPRLKDIGIELTVTAMPFDRMVDCYFGRETRECDMLFLATNFDLLYDPSETFMPGSEPSQLNPTAVNDEELYELTVDMRKTEPGDIAGYCIKWLAFQERLMEELPVLPVYTNAYFDFYTPVLRNYSISEYSSWAEAIVNSYMSDFVPEETEEGTAEEVQSSVEIIEN